MWLSRRQILVLLLFLELALGEPHDLQRWVEEKGAQKGEATCSGSHRWKVTVLGFEQRTHYKTVNVFFYYRSR